MSVQNSSPKSVVELLMSKKSDVTKDVVPRSGGPVRRGVAHHVFACPRGDDCKDRGEVVFEKGASYTNPYKHLKSFLSGGDEGSLRALYQDALAELRNSNSVAERTSFVPKSCTATEREKAMHACIRLTTLNKYPISHIKDPELRSFSKFDVNICTKESRKVIFQLVELVELAIKREIAGTRSAITFDGWTDSGVPYLCVYAVYMRKVRFLKRGATAEREELAMPLLSVSPMAMADKDDGYTGPVRDMTSFDVVTHVRQLEDIFAYYGTDLHNWVVCAIGDNEHTFSGNTF